MCRIGVGEQGVLLVEPYKCEILPRWRFATPDAAREPPEAIWQMFQGYGIGHMSWSWLGTILLGVSLAPLVLLTGCGGGGSSSDAAPVTFTQAILPQTHAITVNGQQVEADEVLLSVKDSGSVAGDHQNITALVNKYHLGRTVYEDLAIRDYVLTTSDSQDLTSIVQSLRTEPTVASAEFNNIATAVVAHSAVRAAY